ncbi:MAG: isoprenylcysteine carboxylmethyltransferase family protein [Pseudomonadota bacterium]
MEEFVSACVVALLLCCFLVFSVASYRHFDPKVRSSGNELIRYFSLAATIGLCGLFALRWPAPIWGAIGAGGLAFLSLALFRASVRAVPSGILHVAFTDGSPDQLMTQGIYGRIRNPLYTSYLTYWFAWVFALAIHPASLIVFAGFILLYSRAIAQEERVLAARFRDDYAAYMSMAGRFLPRLLGRSG